MILLKPEQGLFRRTRSLAETRGFFRPVIHIDAAAMGALASSAVEATLQHEAAHAQGRHALWCTLVLLLLPPLYPAARALSELVADSRCIDKVGWSAFIQMVAFHGRPTTLWGKLIYGNRARRVAWYRRNLKSRPT